MIWKAQWDGGFVVGGEGNLRLTPNFRLKEFVRPDGRVKVHRELVTALQMLRERFGKPLAIRRVDDDGLGADVRCASVPDLLGAAERVRAHHLFREVAAAGDLVHVAIPDPAALPPIELEQALESAFSVTACFETSGDRFQQVTGNFDGAGMSFGPAQWNFKSGTLVPLFRAFERADPAAFRACFPDADDLEEFRRVLDLPGDQQIRWADAISTGRGKQEIAEPWRGYFQAVGRVTRFRAIMVEEALRMYGAKVVEAVQYLQGLVPEVRIDHLRCLCSLYDLVIQQGSLSKAKPRIEAAVREARPADQFTLVRLAVEARGRTAAAPWQADCVSRRVGILNGVPETVEGHQRANINFYLLRDVRIRDAQTFIGADPTERLQRVADALATGETLLN
ncbi:MAG: hypothetical protein AB7O28_20655 [Vicinamibacterales bacterium]